MLNIKKERKFIGRYFVVNNNNLNICTKLIEDKDLYFVP